MTPEEVEAIRDKIRKFVYIIIGVMAINALLWAVIFELDHAN